MVDSDTKQMNHIWTLKCADDLLMEAKQFALSKGLLKVNFPQEQVWCQ